MITLLFLVLLFREWPSADCFYKSRGSVTKSFVGSSRLFAFRPFHIKAADRKNPILVHEKEAEVVKLLRRWSESEEEFDEQLFQSLLKQKKIFFDNEQLNIDDMKIYYGTKPSELRKLKRKYAPINAYVNKGTKSNPIFVKYSVAMDETEKASNTDANTLIERNQAYKNVSQLLEEEKAIINEQGLVHLVKSKFKPGTPPWLRWSEHRRNQGEYSLTEAIVEYLSPYSDIFKGENVLYRRKAGIIGTQAIADSAREADPLDQLPNRIMHPWPAVQELPFNCRWPTPHPNIISPAVWACKMGMSYYRVDDAIVEQNNDGLVVGGDMMTWWDALRIAAYSREGASRDESQQLPHSTAQSLDEPIPFYNPVHKSTIPDSHIFPYNEVLYDILEKSDDFIEHYQLTETSSSEMQEEETRRRQKLLLNPSMIGSTPIDLHRLENSLTTEEEIQRELRLRYNSSVQMAMSYFREQIGGMNEVYRQDLSDYEILEKLELPNTMLQELPNREVVWNYYADGRPDRTDRVVALRRYNSSTGEPKEEVMTWSRYNETIGATIESYLQAIEQKLYDNLRWELAQRDPRFAKPNRNQEEITQDFASLITQYKAMNILNPNKRDQQRKKKMTLVRPSTDPSKSHYTQYYSKPADAPDASEDQAADIDSADDGDTTE